MLGLSFSLLSIFVFIFAVIYTRESYKQGEGYIFFPRASLFLIYVAFFHMQWWKIQISNDNSDIALTFIISIVVSFTFGFFISLDRVNRESLSVLKELNTWDIEKIANALELSEKKKYKLIDICRNPEKL